MKKIEDGRKPTEFRLNGIVHLTDALRFLIERHGVEDATIPFRGYVGSEATRADGERLPPRSSILGQRSGVECSA